ncbi:hypothetical protein [Xylanibacter muris]|uniref:SMODS-associated NUDIX domain-containing protein n=1 Tax=Xylanibacter muris TaxID=2736290 RepID=A0ABX2AJD1_9BACT|nr:hypothetical protein [Xylanibacter muris]NPD91234.1 hypothetical protein [Xylanibacter muris]
MIDDIQKRLATLVTFCTLICYLFIKFKIHQKVKRFLIELTLVYKWIPFLGKYWAIHKSGIRTFFASQKDIEKYRRYHKIEDYIKKNTYNSFTYFGIWLSNEEKRVELESIIRKMLNEPNIDIKLYFHNPEISLECKRWLSEYYDTENIQEKIKECVDGWIKFRTSIEERTKKDRFRIYLHNCNITFSAFLFNIDSKECNKKKKIIFYDQKLYMQCKEQSISMEIGYSDKKGSLYQRVLAICKNVIKSGVIEAKRLE